MRSDSGQARISVPSRSVTAAMGIGTSIRPGGSILVEVAIEPTTIAMVVVPDLIGRLLDDASRLLVAEGLGYETTEVDDPDDPNAARGLVWWQEPVGGTETLPGTVIAVRISR